MMKATKLKFGTLMILVLVGMLLISGCQNSQSSSVEAATSDQEEVNGEETATSDQKEASEEETVAPDQKEATEEETVAPDQKEATEEETVAPDQEEVTEEETVAPAQEEVTEEEAATPDQEEVSEDASTNEEAIETNMINLQVGNQTFTATLANNSSAEALKDILRQGPLTIAMRDYGNMEKVGDIGQKLPSNNQQITTEAGDLILYMGSAMVIYYDTNSWNFTRLGKINDVTQAELKEALGKGDVSVTFTLAE